MSERSFVHLHVHTHYSMLDGAIKIPDLMARCQELGMPAVAMTDHGNMYGAVEFQKAAKGAGVKSIIGCEVYLCEGPDRRVDTSNKAYHVTLLAQNLVGYQNLTKIVSMAWLDGRHPVSGLPRADFELLRAHAEGIICLSGDLAGEVNQFLLRGKGAEARAVARKYREVFGERYYIEVMDGPLPEFKRCRDGLVQLARELELPMVATNDCHYLRQDDALAHAILMCIGLGKAVDPDVVLSHGLDTLYVKSAEEMWAAFADIPEACENTLRIAEQIDLKIPLGQVFLPRYKVPQSFLDTVATTDPDAILDAYFAHLAQEGLEKRFAEMRRFDVAFDEAAYRARLDEEVGIIQQMKFPGYFLIVWDFINYAKEQGIPVGPGRGSGAGSLVAYALAITDIDPMPYDLLFERFLNPERVSMPDFDIDFCMNRRGEVIEYVTRKYGEHNVGQIVTYGLLKARACVKDVGRALGMPYADTDRIAKMIPEELNITLQQALEREPRLTALFEEDPRIKRVFDIALRLENMARQSGMHAAGIVISEEPLWDYVPICRGANGELVTQFAKNEVEEAGLVKFDFLGLKTLTVIDTAVNLINKGRPKDDPFQIRGIPMRDAPVFQMISKGNTTGVFQLESSGFQTLLMKLKPDCFEDIVAAVALYRPGPLGTGMVDDFIDRKHGRQAIDYPHATLEETLKETYGTIVYQEQVMKIAQNMAGYSLGGADLLRRAMGKKKPSEMDKQRSIFVTGAAAKGIAEAKANEVFDLMAYFAGYGFNKSHSAAYALITYQTGYLKAHYPVEFMAALMSCDRENTDKVVKFINEAKEMGIPVLPPDVNVSDLDFSVSEGKIRFGLGAIKGVGAGAIEEVLEQRASKGRFRSLYDFCERVDLKKMNRKVLEAMIKSGAFDAIGLGGEDASIYALASSRSRMMAALATAMDRGQKAQKDRQAGQATLFGMMEEYYPDSVPWTDKELLAFERESVGFYITGHPLDRYAHEIGLFATHRTDGLEGVRFREEVCVAAVISSIREKIGKSGRRMAFLQAEDQQGTVEVLCFSDAWLEAEAVIKSDEPVLLYGEVKVEGEPGNRSYKVRLARAMLITEARREKVRKVCIELDADKAQPRQLKKLAETLRRFPGRCAAELTLRVESAELAGRTTMALSDDFRVDPSDELLIAVEQIFGGRVVRLG